jgi:two-component sensor histidine kinase/integral membrane sensor domain MASE1
MQIRARKAHSTPSRIGPIGLTLGTAVACFFAAQLSLRLLAQPDGVAAFWPAAGVSSGMLIALGRGARWPVAAGVMAATIIANIMGDRNVWGATAFAFCDAGEALLAAWLVEHYLGPDLSLGTLRNALGLLAAGVVATAASGVGGMVADKLFHSPAAPVWTTWSHWFASDAVGLAAVAPLVIGLGEALREPPSRTEMIEGATALVVLAPTIVLVILLPHEPWQAVRPAVLLFPVLLWLAARYQPVFAAAGSFMISLTIVWTTTFGIGQLGDPAFPICNRILAAQIAIAVCTLTANVLAALFAELRQAREHQDLLIGELDHRVKNVLTRVAAVVKLTSRNCGTVEEFTQAVEGRLQSMAAAHALLSQSRWHGVGLADLLRRQLAPYTIGANISFKGPDVILTSAETQTLAMVVNELVTNAVKYGALSSPDGRVSMSWNCTGGDMAVLRIVWREVCGPPVAASVKSGYGSNLIRDLIPYELGGAVELAFPRDGACCKIEIPLKRRFVPGTPLRLPRVGH